MLGAPKTDAGNRVLHVPADVLPVLADHLDRYVAPGPEAWLFGTKGGTAISPRNFQRVWDRRRDEPSVGRICTFMTSGTRD